VHPIARPQNPPILPALLTYRVNQYKTVFLNFTDI